jgi:NAD(P)-dependent dehydrogenase (short-subunit alcohol dehydrogenase family)
MTKGISYEGKRCVAVGCFSGMGEATARIVGDLGGEIVAVDIKKPAVPHAQFLEVDLRDRGAVDDAVAEITGGGPVDRVFYCAGLPGGSFSDLDVMTVNFIAMRHFNEAMVPQMPGDGAICSISSGAGVAYLMMMEQVNQLLAVGGFEPAQEWVKENLATTGFDGYTFSKMSTILWTMQRGYDITTDTGVRVNCISPGPTDTPMYPHFIEHVGAKFMEMYPRPLKRNSTPEEQGWVMAFLNSDIASYVSAENVFTDGGGCAGILTAKVDMMKLMEEAAAAGAS